MCVCVVLGSSSPGKSRHFLPIYLGEIHKMNRNKACTLLTNTHTHTRITCIEREVRLTDSPTATGGVRVNYENKNSFQIKFAINYFGSVYKLPPQVTSTD